jgi:hypothetical protein
MIVYSKRSVKIAELHFNEDELVPGGIDVVRFQSRPEKVAGTHTYVFHSIVTDLDGDSEQLLSRMHKSTRNLIRQAIRANDLSFELNAAPDLPLTEEFIHFFGGFAAQKHLPPINQSRVLGMQASGSLILSRVTAADGSVLVWHSYVRSGKWARMVHSASLFREAGKGRVALISRANRYQHWLDMVRLRDLGVELYDFGGWYTGQQDAEKLRINQFKESFGGRVTHWFNTDKGMTWKGVFVIQARRAANHMWGKSL